MIPQTEVQPLKIMWETAETILSSAQYVHLDLPQTFDDIVKNIKKFYRTWIPLVWPVGVNSHEKLIIYFLIRDSVNFCYWYGKPSCRPNGSQSGKLAAVLSECFLHTTPGRLFYDRVITKFADRLCEERFTLIDERLACLQELHNCTQREDVLKAVLISPSSALQQMIHHFPRYTSDVFLKRASLFIGEIYKTCGFSGRTTDVGTWETEIWDFPVPADYHLPNVLRGLGLIIYNEELAHVVDTGQLIPKGSGMEAEIRATTVTMCLVLSRMSQCPPPIIDDYLFGRRHEFKTPFHLTITTDY